MEFDPIPLGAVVTEMETGSEMNGRAVITNRALKVRTGWDYPKCNPKFALIDPAHSCHVPKRQMVSDGFDTLSHMMEIYFSKPDEDNVSDDIAEALMKNVIQNLRAAIKDPQDYTAKSNLSHFFNKSSQCLNPFTGCFFLRLAPVRNSPYINGKPPELMTAVSINMAIVDRMQNCKPFPLIAVCISCVRPAGTGNGKPDGCSTD